VRQSADAESQMTAIERIFAYSSLPPEPGYKTTFLARHAVNSNELLNKNLTVKGKVSFNDLIVTYREDLDPVLRNLQLDIPAGSKVGICGRTGRLNCVTNEFDCC
jgi:ATP-binding cassette subfamily C (CFTR/MRP) protein 1